MSRCPLCGSSRITVLDSMHPQAFCCSCGARWIQDGSRQGAIKQVHEPSFMATARSSPGPLLPLLQQSLRLQQRA